MLKIIFDCIYDFSSLVKVMIAICILCENEFMGHEYVLLFISLSSLFYKKTSNSFLRDG